VAAVTRRAANRFVDAGAITRAIHGDGATANLFLLGVAVQAGAVPVTPDAVEAAIDLNGVAVEANLASFRWGRTWVVDPDVVAAAAGTGGTTAPGASGTPPVEVQVGSLPARLDGQVGSLPVDDATQDLVRLLAADLVAYQDEAYAARYLVTVVAAAEAEHLVAPSSCALTEAVARGLHKLMAYKDEYEVARLLLSAEAQEAAEAVGGKGATVRWRLHPPMLRALGWSSKISVPASVGRPAMRLLERGKRLRGTPYDPFGRAEVRRVERALVTEYREAVTRLVGGLSAENLAEAVDMARLALEVRGYEDLKLERAAAVRERLRRLS
jgi:indolepyruvate ferredoxin oxidoreductase